MVGKLLKKRTVSWIVWMHKVTIKGQFKNTLLCTLWSTYFYTSKNMLKKNQLLLWKVSVCNKNNWRNESIVLPAHIHNIISNLHLRQTQKRDTDDKRKQAIPEGHKHPDFMKVIKNIHPRLLKGKKKNKKKNHTHKKQHTHTKKSIRSMIQNVHVFTKPFTKHGSRVIATC